MILKIYMDVDARYHSSTNVNTMYEEVEADVVPDKNNQEAVESEVRPEGASGYPEDLDVDIRDNPSSNVVNMDEAI